MKNMFDLLKACLVEKVKELSYPVYFLMRVVRNVALLIMSSLTILEGRSVPNRLFEYTGPLPSDILAGFEDNQIIGIAGFFAVLWAVVNILYSVALSQINQNNTWSIENIDKLNMMFGAFRDPFELAVLLYYCVYVANATLQLLKNGVLLNEQKIVGGISVVVYVLIIVKYYYDLNITFARKNGIRKSGFCDVNGSILCLDDTVGWRGMIYKVSLISGEWCLTRRKSDINHFLDVEKLYDVVEQDLEHLILIR